jgi:hypothetical protein
LERAVEIAAADHSYERGFRNMVMATLKEIKLERAVAERNNLRALIPPVLFPNPANIPANLR